MGNYIILLGHFFLYTNNHLTEHISYNNLNHKNVYTIYNKRTFKTKYKQLVDYAAFVRPYLKLCCVGEYM